MKRKNNKKFNKRPQNPLNKLSLFQKSDSRFSKKCPLSGKDAPAIDNKNIKLLTRYITDTHKIMPSRITSVSQNVEIVSKKKTELNKKNEDSKKQFKEVADKISNKILKFKKESKENGELYGSVKPKEVSIAFKDILKVEISPSQIDLRQEITQVGKYKININLHAEVTASVNLQIDKIDSI